MRECHFSKFLLQCYTFFLLLSCSQFDKDASFNNMYLDLSNHEIQLEMVSARKVNCVWIFLYVLDSGCQTCNLNIMNDLNELVAIEGYRFSCYFATEATHWKRVVKSMNLDYEVHFGKELVEFENLLCEDGKILLISTDIPDQYQKVCNFDDLLATLQSADSN